MVVPECCGSGWALGQGEVMATLLCTMCATQRGVFEVAPLLCEQTKGPNRGTGSKNANLCLKRRRLDKNEDDGWIVLSYGAVGDGLFTTR